MQLTKYTNKLTKCDKNVTPRDMIKGYHVLPVWTYYHFVVNIKWYEVKKSVVLESVLCCNLVINSLEYEDCCIDCINIKLN